MNLVKIISTEIDSLNRRVVKFLRFGKSDIQTSFETSSCGIDSNPIKDMIAVYVETATKGQTVIIGYINKKQLAAVGELRLYSTNETGVEKFYTWLKNDGTMEIGGDSDNMVRYSKLEDAFNELKADFNSFITAYNTHVHVGVTSGFASSGTTTPGTQSTADITPAKIDEIKTL